MKNVKFNDLQLMNIQYKAEYKKAFDRVLQKGDLILGQEVASFEKEFARYIGVKYGIGVASGTDALILALLALGLKPDDEVIIPVNVYPVAFAVAAAGFKIKLVDTDDSTFNLDLNDLPKKITPRTKVIIAVHLYGKAADISGLMAFAKKRKIVVIEDCSQAHGAMHQGQRVGSFGDVSCFSLYPTKNLGALGDAGIIVTNNQKLASTIGALRQYGEKARYESVMLGRISRLDELHAAFLRIKLKKLQSELHKRLDRAHLYLDGLKSVTQIKLPEYQRKFEHSYHLFVIRAPKRAALQAFLAQRGIQTAIHYPHLLHKVKPFTHLAYSNQDFPNATRLNKEILSLPFHPNMSTVEINYVCKAIQQFYHSW